MKQGLAVLLIVFSVVAAPEIAAAATRTHDDWMPDVAHRVADLRRRTQESAAEARERRRGAAAGDGAEAWRRLAARPPRGSATQPAPPLAAGRLR